MWAPKYHQLRVACIGLCPGLQDLMLPCLRVCGVNRILGVLNPKPRSGDFGFRISEV